MKNNKPAYIYISGSRENTGKTTTCLGIISLLLDKYEAKDIGYIKPVGQHLKKVSDQVSIDTDAELIRSFCQVNGLDEKFVTPIRLGQGFTQEFLKKTDQQKARQELISLLMESIQKIQNKKIVVIEGTGHPGVGAVVGLSNADVANQLGAGILFITGGGIGKSLDTLEIDLSYFFLKKTFVKGIIFNKVKPEKLTKCREYVTEELINQKYGQFFNKAQNTNQINNSPDYNKSHLKIFGFIPYYTPLAWPGMKYIAENWEKQENIKILNAELTKKWQQPINGIRVISLESKSKHLESYIFDRDVVLIPAANIRSLKKIKQCNEQLRTKKMEIGGIILTCGRTEELKNEVLSQIYAMEIPAIYVNSDTATSEAILLKILEYVKIQTYENDKYEQIKYLYKTYIDADELFLEFGI